MSIDTCCNTHEQRSLANVYSFVLINRVYSGSRAFSNVAVVALEKRKVQNNCKINTNYRLGSRGMLLSDETNFEMYSPDCDCMKI